MAQEVDFDTLSRKVNESGAAAAPQTSNMENWGICGLPDGPDLRIRIFRTGNLAYGTDALSFYTAIVSLLQDYQGSGEYQKIFSFVPAAMQHLKESFCRNAHGDYFRIRTFQYAPQVEVADGTTIDSNRPRHIKTGAFLLISFALLQVPDAASAACLAHSVALYRRACLGSSSENQECPGSFWCSGLTTGIALMLRFIPSLNSSGYVMSRVVDMLLAFY